MSSMTTILLPSDLPFGYAADKLLSCVRDTKGGRIMFTQMRLLPYVHRTFNILVCKTDSSMKRLRIV